MLRIVHVLGWFSAAVAIWIASLRAGLPASQHLAVLCVGPPSLIPSVHLWIAQANAVVFASLRAGLTASNTVAAGCIQ